MPRPFAGYVFAHTLECVPIPFLIHEVATGHIAFGPPSVLTAKNLIAFFDRTDTARASGRILCHIAILLGLGVRARTVMHIRNPYETRSHRDGTGFGCGRYNSGSMVREKHARPAL